MSALYIYLVLPILFVFFSIIKSISVVDETICLEILTEIAPSLFILNKYWLIFMKNAPLLIYHSVQLCQKYRKCCRGSLK